MRYTCYSPRKSTLSEAPPLFLESSKMTAQLSGGHVAFLPILRPNLDIRWPLPLRFLFRSKKCLFEWRYTYSTHWAEQFKPKRARPHLCNRSGPHVYAFNSPFLFTCNFSFICCFCKSVHLSIFFYEFRVFYRFLAFYLA